MTLNSGNASFENYSPQDRLAMCLMAGSEALVSDVCQEKVVHFNIMNKDFKQRTGGIKIL